MTRTTAIIGGGYSGAMLAARLAEADGTVRLINRTPDFGLGLAYSTTCDAHVLNVRSGRMSARADDPDHFVRWLSDAHPGLADPEGFAPRRIYGQYLQATLAAVEAAHPGRIERIVGEALRLEPAGVVLAGARTIAADAVVLATGNPPPRIAPPGSSPAVIPDPWAPNALKDVRPSDDIVLIGTGLTMIDVVLALDDRGWLGKATALSRRGLTPRPHDAIQPRVAPRTPPAGSLSHRLAEGRARARTDGWAETMDALRDHNSDQWAGLDTTQRARFLRHLRPWWDVHRHRVATGPAARIAALTQAGRLHVLAGKVLEIAPSASGARVAYRPRGSTDPHSLKTDRVIDCTGPGHDPGRSPERLIRSLISSGQARPDHLGLGLDVTGDGRLIDAQGRPAPNRFVLGPPAIAAHWETVAVPDIRERIEGLIKPLTQ